VHSYFVAYELVKDALKPAGSTDLSVPAVIAAGASAGVAMWSIALPADTIKSKLQSAKEGTYKGVGDCVRRTYAEGGWKGFYHGFGPAMARAVPANVS
jgi:solute carrier family 25 carnitine/acylcarnitine transporter 20/29